MLACALQASQPQGTIPVSMQAPETSPEARATEATQPTVEMPTDAELPFETRLLNQILFGRAGLRAGWRIVLFLVGFVFFAAFSEILLTLLSGHLAIVPSAGQQHGLSAMTLMRGEMDSVVGMIGGFLAVMLVCRQSMRDYFLVDRRWFFRIAMGAVSGFVALTALLGAMVELQFARLGGASELQFAQMLWQALLWAVGFLLVALFEEGTFRCFLLRTLETAFGGEQRGAHVWWGAAVLSSLVFGGIHWSNHGESPIGISSAAAIGFIFCCTIRWTGSVWWAVGFHAAWDWAQTFFYGTADSGLLPQTHWLTTGLAGPSLWTGGATGPEGSLLILPLLVLILLVSYLAYGRRSAKISF